MGGLLDWSSLPEGIWGTILEKLPVEDYLRSGSVCLSLRSIVLHMKQCNSESRVPWLMIPDYWFRITGACSYSVIGDEAAWKLFNVATRKVHNIFLPELRNSNICGFSEGWLILADRNTADLRLFNPFTKTQIQLPLTSTFPDLVRVERDVQGHPTKYHILGSCGSVLELDSEETSRKYIGNAFLSSWGSSLSYAVVVEYGFGCHLAFARAGDKVWTSLQTNIYESHGTRCTFSEGIFYLIGNKETGVLSFDLRSSVTPPPVIQQAPPLRRPLTEPGCFYKGDGADSLSVLPESGELLMLRWAASSAGSSPGRELYDVFKLDNKTMEWVEMSSLRGLFFFRARSENGCYYSITCHSIKELQGNCCMYSTDHRRDMLVFDMEEQKKRPYHSTLLRDGNDRDRPMPFWMAPILVNLAEPNNIG